MKKLLALLITFLCLNTKAQTWATIPDANFVTYLQSIIPGAMNSNQMDTSSALVTTTHSINISGQSISNLSGIQYFTSLTYLDCSRNNLTNLPAIPNSLTYLDCSNNNLTNLPALPNSLKHLICRYNIHIHTLPNLPNTLTYLDCSSAYVSYCTGAQGGNPPAYGYLNSLPTLPSLLDTLMCCNNSITCFPTFPNSLVYVVIDNPYSCLPNYVLPAMNSYTNTPLCEAGNTYGCPVAPSCTASTGVSFSLIQDAAPNTWDAYPAYPSNIKTATWYWGDGHYTVGLYPSHTYTSPGLRNICVYITDSNSCGTNFCQTDSVYRLAYNSTYSTMAYINVKNTTTGISQISGLNTQISIYPNPSNGNFKLQVSNEQVREIKIYDVSGKLVLSLSINGNTTINASTLNEGVYTISISSYEGTTNKKLVIIR